MMFVISFSISFFLLNIQTTVSDVYVYNDSSTLFADFDDQIAGFGPSFPSSGLKGYITTTNPQNACKPISPPPNIPTLGYHWIALIPRTEGSDSCEFQIKVLNAQNANFSAVIVYNYENALITMGTSGKNVRIPSTLITRSSGLSLISRYVYNKTSDNSTPIFHVKIDSEQEFDYRKYLVPFAVTISVLFVIIIIFMIVKCYLQRRRARRHRLPKSALKQLKIKKFVKGDPWEVCAICLDDYVDGAKLRILPCDHAYHMKCIDPWLVNSRRQCPVCKRYVFPNQENSEEENSGHQQRRISTEQTPLIGSNENNPSIEVSRNRRLPERRSLNPSGSGIPNVVFASSESSDGNEDYFSSSQPTTASHLTTTEIVFNRPSSNSRRYGSIRNSSTTPYSGTTEAKNTSVHSVVEDVSDIEAVDDDADERMHSVITESEENPAYVHDEESTTDTFHTNL